MEEKMFCCDKCGQKFQYRRNLYRHSTNRHGIDLRPLERSVYIYTCASCEFACTQKKQLISHIRINHNNSSPKRKNRIKCPLCDVHVKSYRCLNQHIIQIHDIPVEEEKLEFQNEAEFLTWKINIEKETQNHYIAERGVLKRKTSLHREYVCYRSYKSVLKNTERKRALKDLGSNKIGAVCPSRMIVTIEPEKVLVNFVRCHVGHSDEIIRMRLFDDERAEIAEKLKKGVAIRRILQEARDFVDPKSSTRLHNLKRKDIYNIIRDFSIDYTKAKENSRNIKDQNYQNIESSNDASFENVHNQIYKPINPTHNNASDYLIVESETLIKTNQHSNDTKSINSTQEFKEKLQIMLALVENISEDDIEIVSKKLDELMVYFRNGSSKKNSNCEMSPQRNPEIELNGRSAISLTPADDEIYMEAHSGIEEIIIEHIYVN